MPQVNAAIFILKEEFLNSKRGEQLVSFSKGQKCSHLEVRGGWSKSNSEMSSFGIDTG